MFQDLPRYESYVPAGEWIPSVPESWGWEPARTIFSERKETDHVDAQMLSVTIGRGVIRQADLIAATAKKDSSNLDKSKYKLVVPGDLVYNKMRAWQGAAGGSEYLGIVSPAYIVMTPRSGLIEYFHHVVRTPMFAKEAERWSYGITSDQWSLRPEHFKMIRFPVPPRAEQAAIVKYLTHADARITKAIAAKRRLIALLKEERAARRSNLLDGLGPWQRLGTVLWEGPTNGVSPEVSENGDLQTFSIAVVRDGIIDVRDSDVKYVDPSRVRDAGKYRLRHGDVLLVRGNGNINLVGRAGLVVDDMEDRIYPDLLMRMRFRSCVVPRFIVAVLNSPSVRQQIENTARTAVGTYKLSGADVRSIRVPVPDLDVQHSIIHQLNQIDSPHLEAVEKLRREIAILQEFRTRLVSDVVTGQVDVRGVAATLPDMVEVGADAGDEDSPELDEELVDGLEGADV